MIYFKALREDTCAECDGEGRLDVLTLEAEIINVECSDCLSTGFVETEVVVPLNELKKMLEDK